MHRTIKNQTQKKELTAVSKVYAVRLNTDVQEAFDSMHHDLFQINRLIDPQI